MAPGPLTLAIYRGDSYRWEFTLWQDAAKTLPYDLTDVVPKAEIRKAPGGSLLTTLGLIVVPPNIITAELTAAQSALLTAPGGAWDLQLSYSNGDVLTILAGAVVVTMDVTDSTVSATPLHRGRVLPRAA